MSDGNEEAAIAGEIGPEGRSRFRIVRQHQSYQIGANVRPCEHRHVVLDERFSTVTCEKCGERLQAFDILLRSAEWWEELLRTRDNAARAEERLAVAEMRRLAALRYVSDDERAELEAAIARSHGWSRDDNPKTRRAEFGKLISRVRSAYLSRKHDRRIGKSVPATRGLA